MAVILVFFNPSASVRIIQNILTVVHWLSKANIPYFIGELATHDTPFLFTPTDNIFQYRSNSYMFYKENLIHQIEKQLPATYTKLCLLDSDILFNKPDWYDGVSETLDHVEVCQPFQKAHMLDIAYRPCKTVVSILDASSVSNIRLGEYHWPGYVWALQRAWFTSRKPSDLTVNGGGDTMIYQYITKNILARSPTMLVYNFLTPQITALPSTTYSSAPYEIYHLNHGVLKNRQYVSRSETFSGILEEIEPSFTIPDVIERRADGILEWKPEYRIQFNRYFSAYFAARADDSSAVGVITPARQKIYPMPYTAPSKKDMAVLLVYFNPVGYVRSLQNLLTTKHWLESAQIPYYIAELAHADTPFVFEPAGNIFQTRANSIMFHKENLIRFAERRIPHRFTKLCMIDADILFEKPNWYSVISTTLNTKKVIQPFKAANWLDIDYTVCLTAPSSMENSSGHPGFAYAFDREFFRRFVLEDRCVFCTGGDSILNNHLFLGKIQYSHHIKSLFITSASRQIPDRKLLGFIPGNIYHLNHGPRVSRKYGDIVRTWGSIFRTDAITDIDTVIVRRSDLILEWAPTHRERYNQIMLDYFTSREEDNGATS